MGEVKIYRGTVNGEKNVLITEHWDGIDNRWRILFPQNGIRYCDFEQAKDLTELELHEAGTGVWIEGVTDWQLRQLAEWSEHRTRLSYVHRQQFEKTRTAILAQLSDTAKAREETTSDGTSHFGEYVDIPMLKEDAELLRKVLLNTPALVHRDGTPSKETKLCINLSSTISGILTPPPVELPEPKEPELYGTIVLRDGYAFQKNHVFSHYGIPAKEWFRSGSDTAYTWDDIKDGAEVIYDPSRVIGGEK